MKIILKCLAIILTISGFANGATVSASKFWVYVGGSAGITLMELDTAAGVLSPHGVAIDSPANFIDIATAGSFLCATGSVRQGDAKPKGNQVFSASIDGKTGALKLINSQPSSGDGPCYVTLNKAADHALVANYSSATVAVFPILPGGELRSASSALQQVGSGPDHDRQKHAYAHSVNLSPDERFAFVADLGADKLFSYKFEVTTGQLSPNAVPFSAVPPGSGPRHFTFDASGRHCYLVNEMAETLIVYQYIAETGTLMQIQIAPLLPPNPPAGTTAAEVQIHPNGQFLYASSRLGTDLLTIFKIDPSTGKVTLVDYQKTLGKTPRHFRIDPSGKFLIAANQDSDNVVLFRIDGDTGKLTPVGDPIPVTHPQMVSYVPVTE